MATQNKFYGKYRGTVMINVDPEQRGRIMAMVPDVLGLIPSSWAMPCFPIAGKQQGTYFIPQIGAGVWVEFENGDPSYPIWTGCFWGSAAEVPALALAGNPASPNIVLQTTLQNAVVISDLPGPTGGIMLKSTTGATHHRQRHRHLHPERQGREHGHDRAHGHGQQRRAGGGLKEAMTCLDFFSTLARR